MQFGLHERNNAMIHTWSYTSGSSDTPLLGITIGDMFDQTVARLGTTRR
jgi:hypothetical protein